MPPPDINRFNNTTNPSQGAVNFSGGINSSSNSQALIYQSATHAYMGAKRLPNGRVVDTLLPLSDANTSFMFLGADERKTLYDQMDSWYGKGRWDKSYVPKFYSRAVKASAYEYTYNQKKITPLDAYAFIVAEEARAGAPAGGGGGGNGVSQSTSTQVNLTDPGSARKLVDDALSQYLGRRANPNEQAKFYKALNVMERESPVVTTTTRSGSGASTVSQGGFNPSTFSEEWARGQQGSGEYQAATTYLNAFIDSLKATI